MQVGAIIRVLLQYEILRGPCDGREWYEVEKYLSGFTKVEDN
jgi:hypothetical protein